VRLQWTASLRSRTEPRRLRGVKAETLPLAFGALGVGYFAVTHLRKPEPTDIVAVRRWESHARDAKVGLVAGLAAAAVLWFARPTRRVAH
jgi:hypothetical protein